jgi:hypothetical protein
MLDNRATPVISFQIRAMETLGQIVIPILEIVTSYVLN